MRNRITGSGPGYRRVPHYMATLGIDSDQMGVNCAHKQRVAENRQPAIHPAAARARTFWRIRVHPEDSSRGRIQGYHIIWGLHGIHHAIHYQRRSFELLERMSLKDPLKLIRSRSSKLRRW